MRRHKDSYISYVGTYFFYFFGLAACSSTVLSVYLRDIGKDPVEISFIISAASLFSVGIVPLSGWLFDRSTHTKRLIRVFFILAGLLGLAFAASRQIWLLFLLNGLMAACFGSLDPVCQKMAASSQYRYGAIRIWGTIGFAAATQMGAWLIYHEQAKLVFVLVPASTLLAALFHSFTQPESLPPESAPQERPENPRGFLKNPYFLLYLGISTLFFSISGANMTYSPLLLQNLGISTDRVGTVLSLSTLVELPVLLFSNRFMDRFNGKTLLRVSFVMAGLQYLCYGLSRSAWVTVAVLFVLRSTSATLYMMVGLKIVCNLVPSKLTTTALGLVSSVNSVGLGLLLNISGRIVQGLGMETLYLIYAGLCALGILLTSFLKIGNTASVFNGTPQTETEPVSSAS